MAATRLSSHLGPHLQAWTGSPPRSCHTRSDLGKANPCSPSATSSVPVAVPRVLTAPPTSVACRWPSSAAMLGCIVRIAEEPQEHGDDHRYHEEEAQRDGHDAHHDADAARGAADATTHPVTEPSDPGRRQREREMGQSPSGPSEPSGDEAEPPFGLDNGRRVDAGGRGYGGSDTASAEKPSVVAWRSRYGQLLRVVQSHRLRLSLTGRFLSGPIPKRSTHSGHESSRRGISTTGFVSWGRCLVHSTASPRSSGPTVEN